MLGIPENNKPSDGYFSPEFVEKAPSPETFIERALLSLRKEAIAQIQRKDLNYSATIEPKIDQIIKSLESKDLEKFFWRQSNLDQLGFFLLDLENPKKSPADLLEIFHNLPEDARSFLKNSIPKNLEPQLEKDPKILLQLVNSEGMNPIEYLMEKLYKHGYIKKNLKIPVFDLSQTPLIKEYDTFVQKTYEKIADHLCKGKHSKKMFDFALHMTNPRLKTEIVKFLAQKESDKIIHYIEDFKIENQADLVEIAKLCAQNNGFKTVEHIQKFGIKKEADRLEIAKLCAQNNTNATAWRIQNFNLQDEASRLEVAKLCAQTNGFYTVPYIQNFDIKKEADRIEIAKLCVKNNAPNMPYFIQYFKIENQADLLEIANLCAENNPSATALYIQNFGIKEEANRLKIAKLCAQNNTSTISTSIQQFEFQDEASRLEIAKLCAQNDSLNMAQYYENFNITDPNKIVELLKICINTSIEAAEYILGDSFNGFSTKNLLDDLLSFSIEKVLLRDPFTEKCAKHFQLIKQFVDEKIANNERLENFLKKNSSDISYVKVYIVIKKLKVNLDPELTEYFISAMSFRNVSLSITMLQELCALVSQNKIETYKKLASIVPLRLPMIFIAKWAVNSSDESSDELENLKNCLHSLREDLKNAKKNLMQRWLMVCQALDQSPIAEKITLLNWVCSQLPDDESKAQELTNRLSCLYILCKENSEALANIPQESSPGVYLKNQFTNLLKKDTYLDLSNIENIAEKYINTLGSMRIPHAWKIYEESLKSIDDDEIQAIFRQLIINILNNEMPGARYALCGEHIEYIATFHPDVWKNWQKTVTNQQVLLDSSLESLDFKDFLIEKLDQGHLKNIKDSLEELIEFLKNPSTENAAYIECGKAPNGSLKAVQFLLMQLYLNPYASQKIIQNDKWKDLLLPLKKFELHNDLVGLKTNLTKAVNNKTELLLVDTDDWQDAMLCGTEVEGSCQRIDGSSDFNKCLLAYIIDGKNRILALKDPHTGKIVARSIFRLLLNENQPVLFQDRLYPTPLPPAFAEALHSFAKQRARELGLPLYTLEERQDTEESEAQLVSLRSPAPFEYEDAVEGVMPNGIFTINNPRKVINYIDD